MYFYKINRKVKFILGTKRIDVVSDYRDSYLFLRSKKQQKQNHFTKLN